jgi:IclR family transcriptional regulator, acetate operon repressor
MKQRSDKRNDDPPAAKPLATVEKAIDVLFHLHREPGPLGVTAIGRALGLPKSSTHRLLQALGRRSLVEQDERGRYRPGVGLLALGLGALDREPVVVVARRVLEEEVQDLGETFFLVSARAGEIVVLDKAEGTGMLRAAPRVGSKVPVHATAVGKLYLAHAPESVRSSSHELAQFTGRTHTDREQLARDVAEARERGWAENDEEWVEGLHVVAAPVLTAGRLVAALAVAVPASRMSVLGVTQVAERAMRAARRIEARLQGGVP